MDNYSRYREVIPDQTTLDEWKEITVDTGSSQSTLEDIKVPEKAGGYCFKDTSKYYLCNRFINWRIKHDVLELVEQSLNVDLVNNRVRYKFTDTPILDGISIHETDISVVILIITVSSIHKLCFAHPNIIHKHKKNSSSLVDITMQSILSEVSTQNLEDSHTFHLIHTTSLPDSPIAHAAASCLDISRGEAFFSLAFYSDTILLFRMSTKTSLVQSYELKQDSIVPRFLSGIATAIRGRSTGYKSSISLTMHSDNSDTTLFALCRDGQLRIWSCIKTQCITVIDLASNNSIPKRNIQNHIIKKFSDGRDKLYLCSYLQLEQSSEFSIFEGLQENGTFQLTRMNTLLSSNYNLVDFTFTMAQIWAVWRTSDIDTIAVTHAELPAHKSRSNIEWESVLLEQPPDTDYIMSDSGIDPRQAYIDHIFHPKKFSTTDIIRALSIYHRSSSLDSIIISSTSLKEKVYMAVEAEIQADVMDFELTDDEYLDIVNRSWSKFYSCILQYHLNESRPTGIFLLHYIHGAILLKKSSFSILRPMEVPEHLMLCNENRYDQRFKFPLIVSQDERTCQDLIILFLTLLELEVKSSEDLKVFFVRELRRLRSPDIIVDNVFSKLNCGAHEMFSDYNFQTEICQRLVNVRDIDTAIATLLEVLTYDFVPQKNEMDNGMYNIRNEFHENFSFSSHLGISTVSEITAQVITTRFSICRNLLVLQQILLTRSDFYNTQCLQTVRSSLIPRTVVLTQAYQFLLWTSECIVPMSTRILSLEASNRHISVSEPFSINESEKQYSQCTSSLLELFIRSGLRENIDLDPGAQFNDKSNTSQPTTFLIYVNLIIKSMWPVSGNSVFSEWLLTSSLLVQLQENVRLLSTWCEWNSSSRKFFLALSFLEMGEPQKACDHFLKAANGILDNEYLLDYLSLKPTSERNLISLVLYYLRVIEILEQYNAHDCIIEIATIAMTVADVDEHNLPTLYSIVFAQHLHLQHYIEAYNSLNTNPDAARRVDCLRQLVMTLFNLGKWKDLISFPYTEMYQDLERIMEAKARSIDLLDNNYYDFLYSFHINNGNTRKAATIMYEQVIRLSQESPTVSIISRLSHCLLACINAMHLVDGKYKWIVIPSIKKYYTEKLDPSKVRTVDSDDVLKFKSNKLMEVMELQDIKKDYMIYESKFKLANLNSDYSIPGQNCPSEIVATLTNTGLYSDALELCHYFDLSKIPVFENLTLQCVNLSQVGDSKSWDWIHRNNVLDLDASTMRIVDISWYLLRHLISRHEQAGASILHKGVAKKILECGLLLPQWLLSSYMKRNASELLRLMIDTGRLHDATIFSLEYMNAMLGRGNEYFGFETSLSAILPPVRLPINILEILSAELEISSKEDGVYVEMHEQLKNTLLKYTKNVENISNDMVNLRRLSSLKA